MKKKALFLDRDGIINIDSGYVHKKEKFIFLKEIFLLCIEAQKLNLQIIVITNQAGIGRGYYTKKDFHILNDWMVNEFKSRGIKILDVFYCPYHPIHGIGEYKKESECRKPKPGMLLKAQEKHNISMKKSWFIGDKEDDISAANRAGINKTILVKSGHKIDQRITKAKFILRSIKDSQKIILT